MRAGLNQAYSIGWPNGVLAFVTSTQPLFKRSITPSALTTSAVSYVRLHGRNYQSWFQENKFAGERYDYLYSVEELAPWLDRIKAVEQAAEDTYVVINNHYLGKGVVNALQILTILKDQPAIIPESLLERYPEPREFATTDDGDGQLSFPTGFRFRAD